MVWLERIVITTVAAVAVLTPPYMAAGIAVAIGDSSSSEGSEGGQWVPEAIRMTAISAATLVIPAITAMTRPFGPAFCPALGATLSAALFARFDLNDISLSCSHGRLAYGADR